MGDMSPSHVMVSMFEAQELVGNASSEGLLLKAKLVAKYAGVLLRVSRTEGPDPPVLKGCLGGASLPAGTAAALKYLAGQGSRQLYPLPPFKGDALQTAAQIDSWVDFSGTTLVKALQRWESAASAKVHHAIQASSHTVQCTATLRQNLGKCIKRWK